jgi:hypothetical protein
MVQTADRTWQGQQTSEARQHTEGPVARTIEQQTAKLPSDLFLWAALGAMGVSLALQLMGKKAESLFIGQWPAPFLLMGLYNKVVKVAGSDRMRRDGSASMNG